MAEHIEIAGGAGPEEAAAIAAVVARIEADEVAAAAIRPRPIARSQWAQAGRPAEQRAPISPEDYHKRPPHLPIDPPAR